MTPQKWLAGARADARARGLDVTEAVLDAFARAMQVLRDAPWNDRPAPAPQGRPENATDEPR